MGATPIHTEAAQSLCEESVVNASYTVLSYAAKDLPEAYIGLVFSKWLRSLRYGNDFFRLIDAESYYKAYHPVVTAVLSKPEAVVRIAVLTDDHDVALGFSVSRGNVLDYVYVDRLNRRIGIGKSLVPGTIDTISHVTKTGLTIWGSKAGHWKFNPFS